MPGMGHKKLIPTSLYINYSCNKFQSPSLLKKLLKNCDNKYEKSLVVNNNLKTCAPPAYLQLNIST